MFSVGPSPDSPTRARPGKTLEDAHTPPDRRDASGTLAGGRGHGARETRAEVTRAPSRQRCRPALPWPSASFLPRGQMARGQCGGSRRPPARVSGLRAADGEDSGRGEASRGLGAQSGPAFPRRVQRAMGARPAARHLPLADALKGREEGEETGRCSHGSPQDGALGLPS